MALALPSELTPYVAYLARCKSTIEEAAAIDSAAGGAKVYFSIAPEDRSNYSIYLLYGTTVCY